MYLDQSQRDPSAPPTHSSCHRYDYERGRSHHHVGPHPQVNAIPHLCNNGGHRTCTPDDRLEMIKYMKVTIRYNIMRIRYSTFPFVCL